MALNPDAVGFETEALPTSWTSTDVLLYAVSLGMGSADLAFSTENSTDVEQRVLPTFPVVVKNPTRATGAIGSFDPAMLVHGKQSVTLHRPIPPAGEAMISSKIVAMWDKGSAAVVEVESYATTDDEPLFSLASAMFIRGEGGWGGERGPSGARNVPPDTAPDVEVVYQTAPDQAYLYRLNGDRNPLHSDPKFAARAGFDQPILHGLCTYGFTGRALLHELCGNDPARFDHVEGRFASPVIPGEALTVRAWHARDGEAVFTTSVGDRLVIDQGLLGHH